MLLVVMNRSMTVNVLRHQYLRILVIETSFQWHNILVLAWGTGLNCQIEVQMLRSWTFTLLVVMNQSMTVKVLQRQYLSILVIETGFQWLNILVLIWGTGLNCQIEVQMLRSWTLLF